MSTPIEARSISTLTNLLANPPNYPRNPTHQTHEPLVLYIVRVPGSKDVFLTPLKPPTKVSISLEAIQSSLYYLHVESAEDDTIRQSLEVERELEFQKRPAPSVFRKPLPPTPFANYPASQRPPTPPKSYPNYQPAGSVNGSQIDRLISRGSHLRLNLARTNSVPRKPLGARPPPSQQAADENQCSSADLNLLEPSIDTRRWSTPHRKPAPWAPRLQVPEQPFLPNISETGQDEPANPSQSPVQQEGPDGVTTITIIRRDPISGIQWNVGTVEVTRRRSSMALLQPVTMTLTSPGYTKFARTPDSPWKAQRLEDALQNQSPNSASPTSARSDHVFRRRLGFRPLPNNEKPSLQHVRTDSSDVLGDMTNGTSKKVQQVYAFTSLWQGTCAFSNGVDGRTLRCKHSLLTPNSHVEEASAPVAEIRFNLPWSVLRPRDLNRQRDFEADKLPIHQLMSKSTKDQWRKSMQTFKHHSWHGKKDFDSAPIASASTVRSELVKDDESRISLKLGREKAGGGFKGNSAKLGKLIIEDEGLKMCDLVVASCMGVWWQHYSEGAT